MKEIANINHTTLIYTYICMILFGTDTSKMHKHMPLNITQRKRCTIKTI